MMEQGLEFSLGPGDYYWVPGFLNVGTQILVGSGGSVKVQG